MYLMLAFFGYLLNILGPITPFLMEEFNLSYTLSSLHFTAFAAGMILVGLGGHYVIEVIGRWKALWLGSLGLSLGVLILIIGKEPIITISACLLMGTTGSVIPVLVSSFLSDQYGDQRSVALAEANFISSSASAIAPLLVGWFAATSGFLFAGWRLALAIMIIAPLLMRLGIRQTGSPNRSSRVEAGATGTNTMNSLPARFWVFWAGIVLSVSIEFCMIFWSADFLEKNLFLPKASAAQFVSLVLGGMILGRLAGSRLVGRFTEREGIILSIGLIAVGFLLFWLSGVIPVSLFGLFLTGLGIANLYPFTLSLALEAAAGQAVQASTRALLASGVAILCLPLFLGRLADYFGIFSAFSVILFLLFGLFLITWTVRKTRPAM